ncbi:Hypothetical protein A7982_09483 [Minicystis rosea]|nr:Hypothetical protein A7982_09483 [Minicystis rosea]
MSWRQALFAKRPFENGRRALRRWRVSKARVDKSEAPRGIGVRRGARGEPECG